MIKKNFLTAVFTAIFCSFFAQPAVINKSEAFDVPKLLTVDELIGSDSTGFYFERNISVFTKAVYIHKLDLSGKTVFQTKFTFNREEYKDGEVKIVSANLVRGRILLFVCKTVKNKSILLMHEFNNMNGSETGQPKVIGDIEIEVSKDVSPPTPNFLVQFSPDTKKFLVVFEKNFEQSQETILKLFSTEDGKKIWEKKTLSTYLNSTVKSYNYIINDQGYVYYLFNYLRSTKENDYVDGVAMIEAQESQSKIYETPYGEMSPMNTSLKLLDNKLCCYGEFCIGIEKNGRVVREGKNGFFLITFDPKNLAVIKKNFNNLSDDLNAKLDYNWNATVTRVYPQKTFQPLGLTSVNGCLYAIYTHTYGLYVYRTQVNSVGAINSSLASAEMRNREIVVFKYDKNDSFEWMKLIPRHAVRYIGANKHLDNTIGTAVISSKNLSFFYYEKKSNAFDRKTKAESNIITENYSAEKYKPAKSKKKSVLVCTTIDEKGDLSRKVIENKHPATLLYPAFHPNLSLPGRKYTITSNFISKRKRNYNIISISE